MLHGCLDEVSRQGFQSLAMIHIPALVDGQSDDVSSAEAMVEALRSWDEEHPEMIDEVFLVDRENGFAKQLQGSPESP